MSPVHAARVVLDAHPDVVEIQFCGIGGVEDLFAGVANAEGFGDGVGVAVVFEHHGGATGLDELNDGVDFRR